MLNLYVMFHLNLMYSSIPINRRKEVIEKCYWPLLELAGSYEIPIGIELPGYTLEELGRIDSNWIKEARFLLRRRKIEIIGSGYCQIIGPIVPAEVNFYNQKFGLDCYKKIFGASPDIALINEQAYSPGLIAHYKKAGYKAIVMEWDNPYRFHQEWDREWKYYPQRICDDYKNSIPVIWNNAIAFQKFQRYAHGEIDMNEYIAYLITHLGKRERFLSFYGNDAEIFDFRPGRFETEPKVNKGGEWNRLKAIFHMLKKDKRFNFITPSYALRHLKNRFAGKELYLESPGQPIPVKKQEKYNITKWAVTGRDDMGINTKCYQIYSYLKSYKRKAGDLWKRLCYLWSSDFRTHIEHKRWRRFVKDLSMLLKDAKRRSCSRILAIEKHKQGRKKGCRVKIKQSGSKLKVESRNNEIIINCLKGLAIESMTFKNICLKPLIGTIPHGYYEDIKFGADYFTGHTIIQEAVRAKITDLKTVIPKLSKNEGEGYVVIRAGVQTRAGSIKKEIRFYFFEPKVDIFYKFDMSFSYPVSARTGIVTLLPDSFDKKSLYYKTVNGGTNPEVFTIGKDAIRFSDPVNSLISANHCLGATEGWIELGDRQKHVRISADKARMYNVPMIEYCNISNSYFLRCLHSLKETDETSVDNNVLKGEMVFSIKAVKNKK